MKYLKRGYVPVLLIGLLAVLVHTPQQSMAAKAPELNKAKTNVQEKKKVTLHLKRAQKKVKWKSSNKAVAVIKGVSGKRSQRVMVYGKKAGSCKITAQSAGRRYSCRLTVKKGKQGDQEAKPEEPKPEEKTTAITQGAIGVYVSGVTATENSLSVDVTYYNGSLNPGQEACYGESFYIQKKEGDSWVAVEPAEPMAFPAVAILLRNQTEQKKTYKMPKTAQPLTSGRYRICVFLSAGYYSQDAANAGVYQEPVIYNQAEFDIVLPFSGGSVSGTAVPAPSAGVTTPGIPENPTLVPSATSAVATAPPVGTPLVPSASPAVATAPPMGTSTPACTENPNVPQKKMGAKVTSVNHTESSIDVTISLYNGFYDWGLGYSYAFTIEKEVDGEWVTVTSKDPQAFPCVIILLSPQSQGEMTYRITDTESEVTAGHYRLCTDLYPMEAFSEIVIDYQKPVVETDFEFDIP